MRAAAIELNDAGVAVAVDGELLAVSPGYALLGREPPLLGESARAAARREPLSVSNSFWSELSTEPLRSRAAEGRSAADLAYLHLAQIAAVLRDRADAVVCAVPASLGEAKLALTLGIARACGLPLAGFLDAAVAVASAAPLQGNAVHVDLSLHHAVITAVDSAAEAKRGRFEVVYQGGLLALYDTWMRLVARRFVTDTRFDPLHDASIEQAVFDRLPQWLEQLCVDERLEVELAFGEDRHRIVLTREEFELEAQAIYDGILARARRLRGAGQFTIVSLSERAGVMPGLARQLADLHDCTILLCPPGCAAFAAGAHAGLWDANEDDAKLLRSAPRLSADVAAAFAPREVIDTRPRAAPVPPTHLLYRGQAHALRAEPLLVGLEPGAGERRLQVAGARAGISRQHCSVLKTPRGAFVVDHSRHGTWVNDECVPGRAPLRAGDRLRLGTPGITLELIALE